MYLGLFTLILECIALVSGFFCLYKNRRSELRPLVFFLLFTISVELIGSYTRFIDDWAFLYFLKETPFERNFWLYNCFIIVSLFFYIRFYRNRLRFLKFKRFLNYLTIVSIPFTIMIFTNEYFLTYVKAIVLWTSLTVFICTSLYFYELMQSSSILVFYKLPMFYVSLGLFMWWLILPPIALYMPYYSKIYPEFVAFRGYSLFILNVILYSIYTIAFVLDSKPGK